MNPSIFKAYDIRGKYPDEIDEETVYQIARHVVEMLGVEEVVVGYDARISAPKLVPHLYQGIADGGAKIIELGMTGTEVLYFTVGSYNLDSGIMLTASHNPKEYNGLKIVKKGAIALSGEDGIYELRDRVINSPAERLNREVIIKSIDAYEMLKEKIFSLVNYDTDRKLKVVVDPGNGVGGLIFEKIYGGHPNLEIVKLNFEPDGNFPNHEPNPAEIENTHSLIEKVKETNADLGIALDGDADRVFFIDERGGFSNGYFITALLSKKILEKYPNSKIIHECRYEWAIKDAVIKAGGIPIQSKSGHSYIKASMRETGAVFGGETSAHYYFKDTFNADSPLLAIALILELMLDTGKSFSELLSEFEKNYFISGEINYKVEDADVVINRVREKYSAMDGVTTTEPDGPVLEKGREWHISIRKSNTEPLVRLNVEANTQETLDKLLSEVKELIY